MLFLLFWLLSIIVRIRPHLQIDIYTDCICWKWTRRWEDMLFWIFVLKYICQHRNEEICFNRFWCSNDLFYFSGGYSDVSNKNYTSKSIYKQLGFLEMDKKVRIYAFLKLRIGIYMSEEEQRDCFDRFCCSNDLLWCSYVYYGGRDEH